MANQDRTGNSTILKLSHDEIQFLADRLYNRGISCLTTFSPSERQDLVAASRCLRRLLAAYERASGKELHTIFLCGV